MYQTECAKNKHDPAKQLKKVGTVGQESTVFGTLAERLTG